MDLEIPGLPPSKIDGEPNPEHYSALLRQANKVYYETVLIGGANSQFNFAQFQKSVMDAAKLVGITEREVADRRTEAQRSEDVLRALHSDVESAFSIKPEDWEALDRLIETKYGRMDEAELLCRQELEDKCSKEDRAREERVGFDPKALRRRIARILRLRERARFPVPPSCHRGSETRPGLIRQTLECAHLLRFMIYVGRPGVEMYEQFARKREADPSSTIFDISPHHAKFCCSLWMHRNGAKVQLDPETGRHRIVTGLWPCQGSLQVMPVGFGKTELAVHLCGLEMGLRPRTQAYYVHAKHERAKQNVGAIKRFVDPHNGIGQRFLSLFPTKLDKRDNDATHIRVKLKNPPKSPTFTAAGVDAAELGGDADFQVWDDVVPRSDVTEETTRKNRYDVLASTFLTRQRGRNAFVLVIGTFWHYGDALMTIKNKIHEAAASRGAKGMMYGMLIQRCGGPKERHGLKPWHSIWPRLKGSAELKMEYGKLGPSLYSAVFEADPIADAQRIVKKIRLYDPETPEHQSFLFNSVKYISLDPAATDNSRSDKAGIVYAGIGDVRVTRQDASGLTLHDTEKRVRLFNCHEIHATQSALTEYTMSFAKTRLVDYVLAEATSGFAGLIEMFRGLGIDALPMPHRGENKGARLMAVAPILEDISANLGFRAICEWPGVRNDKGELELHPDFKGLAEQVLDFGVSAADHMVDALSYLLGYLSPDLGIGRGIVTEQVKKLEEATGDPRVRAIIKRILGPKQEGSVEDEENKWLSQNWR